MSTQHQKSVDLNLIIATHVCAQSRASLVNKYGVDLHTYIKKHMAILGTEEALIIWTLAATSSRLTFYIFLSSLEQKIHQP
jgi:hypothetical protein